MKDLSLRQDVKMALDLQQMTKERDYLLEERSRILGERADMAELLFDILRDTNTPSFWRDKIEDVVLHLGAFR